MWKPRACLRQKIHSFYLGGSIRLVRLEEIIASEYLDENGRSDVVNRFGLETENSGTVNLRLNIAYQSKETKTY